MLRVGLGVTLLFFLFNLSQDITMFYTDDGFLSRYDAMYLASQWPFNWSYSLHFISGNKVYIAVLFAIQFASAALLTVGYKTRLNCIISWFLLLSLQNRNHFILSGFDLYLRLLLFWSIFLPIHIKYSIDSLIDDKKYSNNYFSAATFTIFIQVCVLYVFSSLLKGIDDKWWVHHTALNYILHNELYLTPIGYALHNYLSNNLLQLITYAVLIIELVTPLVLFFPAGKYLPRLRIFWFLVLTGLHLGFMLFMCIAPFTLISLVGIIILLPKVVWDKLEYLLSKTNIKLFKDHLSKHSAKYLSLTVANNARLKLSKLTNVFLLTSITAVVIINYATYDKKYKYQMPVIYEFATMLGLDQSWELFNRAATMTHMVRFFSIDEQNNERPIWPIAGYNVTNSDMREYFYATKNNWWWKYLIQINLPYSGYNYYKENNLIRAMCLKENRDAQNPKTKKIRVVYNWYSQIYDKQSTEITKKGELAGWYYINNCA